MTAIMARYLLGAFLALLVAKGIIDQSAVESSLAALATIVTGIVEYVKRK